MVLKLVVDTCVWIDLAKDYRDQAVIGALEDFIRDGQIELLVPEVVLEELKRNKDRVIEEAQRSTAFSRMFGSYGKQSIAFARTTETKRRYSRL